MSTHRHDVPLLRIGELERRTGIPATTLRAWQRRYGVIDPARTSSGYRLYSERDVELVLRIQRLLDEGVSIGEAARIVADATLPGASIGEDANTAPSHEPLAAAFAAFDGARAHELLDDLLARLGTSTVLTKVLLPLLRDIEQRQGSGIASIAEEHFASSLIRGRLWGLTRRWDDGDGPRAVLAAAPGDHHDLGLLMFGLCLRERGWRITWLGIDTPSQELAQVMERLEAEAAVVSVTTAVDGIDGASDLRGIARSAMLALGGAGASPALAASLDAHLLETGPVDAARSEVFAIGRRNRA